MANEPGIGYNVAMLSDPIKVLLERLKTQGIHKLPTSEDTASVNVNRLTEKAGAAYEKLRYLVDYKEERHIRRSAIERIIKRKIIFEKGEDIGLSLIQELIAGKYLPNNSIPESSAQEVEAIISKYKTLERHLSENLRREPRVRNILISFMGSEIEEFFFPNNEDDFVVDAFYDSIKDFVRVEVPLEPSFIGTQILVACYRSLLNADDETLRYKLWLKQVRVDWRTLQDDSAISEIATHFETIWNNIFIAQSDPLSFRILPKLGNYAIYFSIIREIIRAYGAESERIIGDHEALDRFTREFLEKNYKSQFSKARGSAVRAIIYIFMTKMLLAIALEVPYQMYFLRSIEYLPIATNVLFHPFLLFLITVSVKKLDDENTKAIESGVHSVLSGENIRLIKINSKQTGFFNSLFLFFYSILFLIVFGAIILFLEKLHFSPVSIFLFLCFLTLVSYFALRIRHSANRWKVARDDTRTTALAFNLFSLPIVRAGRWLSRTFSSINLFVFILDFIIETPFKLILHFSDTFVSFLREKQEDVY